MKRISVLALPILTLLALCAASASAQRLTLLRTLRGHTNEVGTVAFSPDGKTLASGSSEYEPIEGTPGEAKLWNGRTGRLKHTMNDRNNTIGSLVFSPDGKTLASGGWSKYDFSQDVCLWDVQSGKLRRRLAAASDPIAISPDGKFLATGNYRTVFTGGANERLILLWDLRTIHRLRALKSTAPLASLAFSPNGKTLISNSVKQGSDETNETESWIQIWDMPGGKLRRMLTSGWNTVTYSPNGQWRASVNSPLEDGFGITIYDARTGQARQRLAHRQSVYGFAFSPDSKMLVSGSGSTVGDKPASGRIDFWDTATGHLKATRRLSSQVLSVAVSPDGRRLATGMGDDTVKLWRLN